MAEQADGTARLDRRLVTRVREVLDELQLPEPFDPVQLLESYGQLTGRPILVTPVPLRADSSLFAAWLRSGTGTDYVFYAEAATPEHRTVLLGHEFGHMIAGHADGGHTDGLPQPVIDSIVGSIVDTTVVELPDLDPEMVRQRLYGRSIYDRKDEREAELIGTFVQQWARQRGATTLNPTGSSDLDSVTDALSWGWR